MLGAQAKSPSILLMMVAVVVVTMAAIVRMAAMLVMVWRGMGSDSS
jgi:hypothetical protein